MIEKLNISALRREYTLGTLRYTDLTKEPMVLFERWLKQACDAKLFEATAMNVSTVDKNNQPYQRIVLLKYFDEKSMVFYTNLRSRKAIHLNYNPHISLHFSWHELERQVLVLGQAKRLSTIDVMQYFYTRPRDSQIGTWISKQSSKIASRKILINKFHEFKNKFKYCKIPFPHFWGGYRVHIEAIEFWQGGEHRLHDRFIYQRNANGWRINRLSP
ncbi:pyridoxamine 5'-phosphate oxidase [Candidatus Curculioniphilus buchneri]|uniref:pyridoxamine 5'-phosphate oxidase n=1 Tax=Candidatus Curculioniphilus buchneri TaxID=690594 RepID=UPI00376EC9FD